MVSCIELTQFKETLEIGNIAHGDDDCYEEDFSQIETSRLNSIDGIEEPEITVMPFRNVCRSVFWHSY